MARGAILIAMIALAGCKQEPTFDERYDAARSTIGETAREIDRDLEQGLARDDGSDALKERGEDARTEVPSQATTAE